MSAYSADTISDELVVPLSTLRVAIGLNDDDDSVDTILTSLCDQAVALVEERTGIVLREQSGQLRCDTPTSVEYRSGVKYGLLSLPIYCKSIAITSGLYWTGSEYADFDLEDLEAVSGPRICWKLPDDQVQRTDTYVFDIDVTPVSVSAYYAPLTSLVTLMYLRSDHPDYSDKISNVLRHISRGL